MGKLFGTDGIRGIAGRYPMTVDMALIIGRVTADFFAKADNNPRPTTIVVGKDTRQSGDMLAGALCAGICDRGADVQLAGVLPTPGIAFLTRSLGADAGIVISASHNPYQDNGIKIFTRRGYKLSTDQEAELEARILSAPELAGLGGAAGRIHSLRSAATLYADFLKTVPENETGKADNVAGGGHPGDDLKLVIDCANGAVSDVAVDVFPGATLLFASPDGRNINNGCGSEHPEALSTEVINQGASAGFAFDGDGDRVVAVDENGMMVSGDRIIAFCAGYLKENGRLRNNTAVSTVMSNIGLSRFLEEQGVVHVTTDVGDRHVLERMRACGAVIGGEDSGHIIFSEYQTTGDGMLTALMICEIMKRTGKPLSELASCMTVYPQELINVPVREKPDLVTLSNVQREIESIESALGQSGRVLVRYSGTQPLCRVMVEAAASNQAREAAARIVEAIRREIGSLE